MGPDPSHRPPPTPSRLLAFILVLVAASSLLMPVWYTAKVHHQFGPFGSLIAWTTASVGIFATLTVLASVIRHFIAPAIQAKLDERNL
jgi:hypothetical protein